LIFIKIENSFELKIKEDVSNEIRRSKIFWKKDNEIFAKEKSF